MAKAKTTRYQKFVKSEKNKTKLKNKKELPKGTNVTDTKFKVKKIIIRDKIKDTGTGDKYVAPIKEILSKLQHFNNGVRTEALSSLSRYLSSSESSSATVSLRNILLALVPLVLDKERNVRRESFKVIHCALSPLSFEQIEPFFDILSSYLRCSMTHIDVHIHEDSLQFFDVLLLCTPTLLAKNFYNILPSFLDMISKLRADSKPGRTLSVNLGSKMTSIKWRSKVLSRLHQFLEVFAKEKQHNDYLILQNKKDLTKISHIYNKEKVNYFPIYKQTVQSKLSCFYKNKIENMTNDTEMDKIKSYIDSLLPLLFETWLEIRPDSNDTKVESSISEETSFLLKCILEIILMFWNIINTIENEYRSNDLSTWFKKTYYQKFSEYFLLYFPYTCNTASNKRNQSKQKPINSTNDMCLLQNLMIVHIYIIFKDNNVTANLKENKQTIIFTKNNIKEICNGDTKVQKELLSCLKKILSYEDFPKSSSVVDLLNALTTIYTSNDLPKSFEQDLFEVLCVILKHNDFKKLLKFDSISLWLHAIIDMLISSSNISVEVFDIILQFAIHHNELFNATLRENLVKVLHNLPKITLNGADNQSSKHKVISLLFWVKPWDNQCLNIISEQLNTDVYSLDDKEFLVDLLKLKVEAVHG